jgi:hypothetical protein
MMGLFSTKFRLKSVGLNVLNSRRSSDPNDLDLEVWYDADAQNENW